MIFNNNIILSFPTKNHCSNILQQFFNNDINERIYLNNSNNLSSCNYFINIKNEQYSHLYSFLLKCIDQSTKILSQQHSLFILKLFSNKNSEWNFCIFNDIMFNLPFTLSNIIFIPINYLTMSYSNNSNVKFSNTLIHEKIHIFQRFNLNKWINIINLSFKNWILIKHNTLIYNYLINYDFKKIGITRILNPDVTYDFLYLYVIENKYYYGFFSLNNSNNIKIIWFCLNNLNKQFNLTLSNNSNLPTEEHPFEMFAYKFSNHLI
jgi:hypothetical protein